MFKVIRVGDDKFIFEGTSLKQNLLTKDDVYLLEDGKYIYVWFGKTVPNDLYKSLFVIGDAYKALVVSSNKLAVLGLKQGFEPKQFKLLFSSWDVNLFPDETDNGDMLRTNEV